MQRMFVTMAAIALVLGCSLRVSAAGGQRIVSLPVGGPYRLNLTALEEEVGPFEAVTVTLPPEKKRAALFLDGEPLRPYRTLTREQAERVRTFVGGKQTASVGIVPFCAREPVEEPVRIRCINPFFRGQTKDGTVPILSIGGII